MVFLRGFLLTFLLCTSFLGVEAQKHRQERVRKMVPIIPQATDDMVAIKQFVKSKFSQWCEKGEFEKAAAVDERLRSSSKLIYDKICFDAVVGQVRQNNNLANVTARSISTYDSEKECFDITLTIQGVKQMVTLKVPISIAPLFKENFQSLSLSYGNSWGLLNGMLYPKILKVEDYDIGYFCEIPIEHDGVKNIEIPFDGMNIDNPYMDGKVFCFHDYLLANKESLQDFMISPDKTKIFDVAEVMPSFPGGIRAMNTYISNSIQYPLGTSVQGRVIVSFVVERNGSLSNVKVVRSVEQSLDKEAIRIIKSMPRWTPGRQDGKVVRVRYTAAVIFRQQ